MAPFVAFAQHAEYAPRGQVDPLEGKDCSQILCRSSPDNGRRPLSSPFGAGRPGVLTVNAVC
jgi:hypothetical protein